MDTLTHKYIVEKSLRRLFSDNKIPNNISDIDKEKIIKMFVKYSSYPDKKEKRNMFLWHFYNPITKQNYIGNGENALSRFIYYSEKAFNAFKKEKKINKHIIKDLAYACHYLADLNEPHHTSDLIGTSIGSKFYLCILIFNDTKWHKINEISKKSNERVYKKNEKTKSLRQSQIREDCKFTDFIYSTKIVDLFSNHMEFEAEISRIVKSSKYNFSNEVCYDFQGNKFLNIISKIGEEFAKKSNSYSKIIANVDGLVISNSKVINNIYIIAENSFLRIILKSLIKYNKKIDDEKFIEFLNILNSKSILPKISPNNINSEIDIEGIINKILDNSILSTIQFLNCFFMLGNK